MRFGRTLWPLNIRNGFMALSLRFRVRVKGEGRTFRVQGYLGFGRATSDVQELHLGFRVLGFGFRVSDYGFRVSGFGFRFGGWGLGFRFRVLGFGLRVSGFEFRASIFGFRFRA